MDKNLLKLAQSGDKIAEEELIRYIRDNVMRKRISRYLHRNRQVEDDDIKQEFLIGVALSIHRASLDIGDPIEYIIQQGIYRVKTYLRKNILQSTSQVCNCCGYETRLNRVGNNYICKRCGSTDIITRELNDHDEVVMMNLEDNSIAEEDVLSRIMVDEFENTLEEGTNVYNLYVLLRDGTNRDNPEIKNYLKEIANQWGCSQNNVVQVMDKLKSRIIKFADDNDMDIIGNKFVPRG